MNEKLHVVLVYFNPIRWKSRIALFKECAARMEQTEGVVLYLAELAYGQRHYELTDPNNPRHFRFRTHTEIFHKESLFNLTVARMPEEAKYIALPDADISFIDPKWAIETLHQLQHFDVVQLFEKAIDLGIKNDVMFVHNGFVSTMLRDGPKIFFEKLFVPYYGQTGSYAHPGYAWAWRRSALLEFGGLLDFSVIGSGDSAMALAYYNNILRAFDQRYLTATMKRKLLIWQERAQRLKQNIGYVPGTLYHNFHGWKADRQYWTRNQALANFDPDRDLKRDTQMLWTLTDANPTLRDHLRKINRARNEDTLV